MAREFIGIARVGNEADLFIKVENETVCLDRMDVPDRHGKGDILYCVRLTGSQRVDGVKVGSYVVGVPQGLRKAHPQGRKARLSS